MVLYLCVFDKQYVEGVASKLEQDGQKNKKKDITSF